MSCPSEFTTSRRRFLQISAAAATALALPSEAVPAAYQEDPYGGFKVGLQSFSLRSYTLAQALDQTRKLGLKYWEATPRHIPLSNVPGTIQEQKALLASRGVTMLAYGVLRFDADENNARAAFEFAKTMGLMALSADPAKDKATFDLLEKLVQEYDVAIAIHNHGPGHRYDKISDVEQMVRDRHPKIGACVDTGHYLRSDEDPVAAIERLGRRVFGVHLKDVKTVMSGEQRREQFTILGEGDLDVLGCLKALRKLDFQYCLAIEYKEHPENPLADLEICLQNVRAAVQKL